LANLCSAFVLAAASFASGAASALLLGAGIGGNTVYIVAIGQSGYSYTVSSKFTVESAHLRYELVTEHYFVDITLGDKTVITIPDSFFTPDHSAARGTTSKDLPPAIAVSNDADTLDIACDGQTVVVAGANSGTPVALVDFSTRREVATAPYAGKLARSVAVDDDGRQALVVLDDENVSVAGEIHRIAIGPATLTDTGERLAFAGEFVSRVYIAPGAHVGVAIVGNGPTRLVSFGLPSLVVKGSVALSGGVGNAVAFSLSGDHVYVRSGQRGPADVVERFTFDPATGAIGQAADLRITGISGFVGVGYQQSMATSADGAYLVVADENLVGALPAPRIAWYDAVTGALAGSLDLPAGTQPRIVATPRACRLGNLVEFHHAAFDHYFVTGIAAEIALLDNGTLAGWTRTGKAFNVYRSGTPNTSATCRFFSDSFAPKSSHFYTPFAAECETVKANPRWTFEGEVFNVALPGADGSCAPPTVPLYRLYNDGQGGAPNHRYTTELDVRQAMITQGWIPEGSGIGVIACVPP
jgi:hypothetical protein